MIFVIGLLLGAVISTSAFFVYTKTTTCNNKHNIQMNGGQPPQMPNGQNNNDNCNGQPQAKQDGSSSQPPEKPSDDNNQTSDKTDTTKE